MTDYYLGVVPQSVEWELRANVARFSSPMGGVTRTHERTGSRWACTFRWDVSFDRDAARLRAFIAQQRGGGNRFLFVDQSYTQRGSFSAPELLTNSDFGTGTANWSLVGTATSLTAADLSLRLNRTANSAAQFYAGQSAATAQYVPVAFRALTSYAGASESTYGVSLTQTGGDTVTDVTGGLGLKTIKTVTSTTAATFYFDSTTASGPSAGSYRDIAYSSAARCALVDNGTNALQRSDELDNAYWTKVGVTITANSNPAPDGTSTADQLVETGAAGGHYVQSTAVTVSSSAADMAFSCAINPSGRSWFAVQLFEATGSTSATVYFNATTGAIGTIQTGANWSNVRAFVTSLGGGYYRLSIVARKTNAATSISAIIGAANADAGGSYTGTLALIAGIIWRATFAVSSGVPTRLVQTTSAATTGTSQTGSAIYLKGLPVSTNNLLYAGDWLEFITPTYSELKRLTAPLNSDAAGLGIALFEPILRQSPADNAAVIVTKPMCRMLLDESTIKTTHTPAGFMSVSFTAVEDVAV